MELPGALTWVLNLVGVQWPNVDEDQLRSSADSMRQISQELNGNTGTAQTGIAQMLQNNSSQSLQMFEALWNKVAGSHLPQMAQGLNILADGLDVAAVVVVGLKAAAIGQLAELAAEILSDQAEAPETFGASEALVPVQTEATSGIMKEIMDQAIQQIEQQLMQAVQQPVINALTSAGQELAGQLVGDVTGQSSGIDLSSVAQAGESGFTQSVQSIASNPLGALGMPSGPSSGDEDAESGDGADFPAQSGELEA